MSATKEFFKFVFVGVSRSHSSVISVYGEFKGDVFLLIVQRHIAFSFSYLAMVALISLFQKILHCAAKDFCEAENRLRAGFIDILVVLLVHLN